MMERATRRLFAAFVRFCLSAVDAESPVNIKTFFGTWLAAFVQVGRTTVILAVLSHRGAGELAVP